MKTPQTHTVTLDRIIGGGQAIGTLENGKKALVWGGLPRETVEFRVTKKKSNFVEGVVTKVLTVSPERVSPTDPDSYLSTSPWQIMSFEAEQHYKAALVEEAFELHGIVLPDPITIYSDGVTEHYRNKVEFSWYGNVDPATGNETLDLAFFRRGSKGKVVVDSCSLLPDAVMTLARGLRDILYRHRVSARSLKTLLIRNNQAGKCVWQLYAKDEQVAVEIAKMDFSSLAAQGGEIIYSDPRSPASRITKRIAQFGETTLTDTILGVPFRYATEGFFQVNIPVYEQALRDMREWTSGATDPGFLTPVQKQSASEETATRVTTNNRVVDFYSGVGSIGLTIGGENVTLVEINEDAVREMRANIAALSSSAHAVLAPSEKALDHIDSHSTIIVDPPRAGLHRDVIGQLLETAPPRIVYLSCNPVTQARDVAMLAERYGVRYHRGYNFFPRTPHIEHLVVLDKKAAG